MASTAPPGWRLALGVGAGVGAVLLGVYLWQSRSGEPSPETTGRVAIIVHRVDGPRVFFQISSHAPLAQLMDLAAERFGAATSAYTFVFDGKEIEAAQTPADLGMRSEATITATLRDRTDTNATASDETVGANVPLAPPRAGEPLRNEGRGDAAAATDHAVAANTVQRDQATSSVIAEQQREAKPVPGKECAQAQTPPSSPGAIGATVGMHGASPCPRPHLRARTRASALTVFPCAV